jgi:peptidoglycan/LPS O-acetylase OafA/YrhL
MLDIWRGVACLMIVLHHAGYALEWSETTAVSSEVDAWLRWGVLLALRRMKLGVSLFFVISGYCIAASADSHRQRGTSPWSFLGRRFWRIYPPYWAALAAFVAVVLLLDFAGLERFHSGSRAIVLDSPTALDLPRWVGNITLTETWRPHVWGPERDVYTGVAWSLCYEEQFYLICFLALLFGGKRLSLILGLGTLAILGVRIAAWSAGRLDQLAGTFPLLWHEFAIGLAVYYRINVARGMIARRATEGVLLAMAAVGWKIGARDLFTAASFGLLLIALHPWERSLSGLRGLGPLRACGRRCYSIYLAHLPVCIVICLWLCEQGLTTFWARALVVVPVGAAAAVTASCCFFAVVESHFLGKPAFSVCPAVRRKVPLASSTVS